MPPELIYGKSIIYFLLQINMKKILIFSVFAIGIFLIGKVMYDANLNYNFQEITKDRVYASGTIPPNKISKYIEKYGIKTVVDLRSAEFTDSLGVTWDPERLEKEKEAIDNLDNVQYINIPTSQQPSDNEINQFLDIMDDNSNYPVLIHCNFGERKSVLFSTIYRIEIEGMSNEEARQKIGFLFKRYNFDKRSERGEYVKNYVKRRGPTSGVTRL